MWNEEISDTEFAAEVNKVTSKATVCIFEQCFSGGMIDNLKAANRVLMSASRFWELSYSMFDNIYNEFSHHLTYAFANPAAADANGDGAVSMEEAYLYALAKDSYQSEDVSVDENVGEHPSYYSYPWDLGRKISLGGYSAGAAPPRLANFTQREVTAPFPSGGIDQGWHGDDEYFPYRLPFAFPLGNKNYDSIYVSTNGIIYLENPDTSGGNTVDGLKWRTAVAPMWDDLTVLAEDGDAIYVTLGASSVTIRWKAHTYTDPVPRPVNFSATLNSSGAIRFLYGDGNDHTSLIEKRDKTIGVSLGNGSTHHLCLRNGGDNLGGANGIEYSPFTSTGSDSLPPILDLLLLR